MEKPTSQPATSFSYDGGDGEGQGMEETRNIVLHTHRREIRDHVRVRGMRCCRQRAAPRTHAEACRGIMEQDMATSEDELNNDVQSNDCGSL